MNIENVGTSNRSREPSNELCGIAGVELSQRRKPEWRRNAKQSAVSVPMRAKPSSALSATALMVVEHRLACSVDLRLAPGVLDGIELGCIAWQPLDG